MPYKTGSWGKQAKERYLRRKKVDYWRKNNKNGEWALGRIGELEAEKIFQEHKLPNGMGADFKIKGSLIDVKTSLPSKTRHIEYWKFYIARQKGKIDYFLFICKNHDKTTEYIFLIPDNDLGKTLNIPIKNVKKYLKYLLKEMR